MSDVMQFISDYAQKKGQFLSSELHNAIQSEHAVSRPVLNAYLAKMANEGKLQRMGRGSYAVPGKHDKNSFIWQPGERALALYQAMKQAFPLVAFCVYEGVWISPLMHHLANNQAIYLETEKDVAEAVFHRLQEKEKAVFLRPSKDVMDKYVFLGDGPVIVKHLVSESPLQKVGNVQIPTLEKLLVDMYCDPDFYYLQGGEYYHICYNAHDYAVNTSKMFRYASRRSVSEEIHKIWEDSIYDFD